MKNKAGFTLIEVLLVVVILGLLSSMVVPRLVGRAEDARNEIAKTDISAGIAEVLDLYELDNGIYPNTLKDLYVKPSSARNWKGPYLKKKADPTDPWGSPYIYRFPGINNSDAYDLYSAGKDGADGSDDDITNWDV